MTVNKKANKPTNQPTITSLFVVILISLFCVKFSFSAEASEEGSVFSKVTNALVNAKVTAEIKYAEFLLQKVLLEKAQKEFDEVISPYRKEYEKFLSDFMNKYKYFNLSLYWKELYFYIEDDNKVEDIFWKFRNLYYIEQDYNKKVKEIKTAIVPELKKARASFYGENINNLNIAVLEIMSRSKGILKILEDIKEVEEIKTDYEKRQETENKLKKGWKDKKQNPASAISQAEQTTKKISK